MVALVVPGSRGRLHRGSRRRETEPIPRESGLQHRNCEPSKSPMAIDPSYFASGACISYPPTMAIEHTIVFLDAGHGGLDPGGVGVTQSGQQIEESIVNLPIELETMSILRAHGFQIVVSRTGDTTVLRLGPGDTDGQLLSLVGSHDDVAARDVCANMAHADLLVGIYMDTGGSPQNAGSVSIYDTDRPFSAANLRFATLLQDDVLSSINAQGWGVPNDGVVSDAAEGSAAGDPEDGGLAAESVNYDHLLLLGPSSPGYFSTPSQMPGAVVEPFFFPIPLRDLSLSTPVHSSLSRRESPWLSRSILRRAARQPLRVRGDYVPVKS